MIVNFTGSAARGTSGHYINCGVAQNGRRLILKKMEEGGDKGQVEFNPEDFLKEEPSGEKR